MLNDIDKQKEKEKPQAIEGSYVAMSTEVQAAVVAYLQTQPFGAVECLIGALRALPTVKIRSV